MFKRLIAYFLLAVISMQLLPVKELGRLLYGNMMTEEWYSAMPENEDLKKSAKDDEIKKPECVYACNILQAHFYTAKNSAAHLCLNSYISRLSDDIPTPPPLFCS